MKKWYVLIAIVFVVWIGKLTFDLQQLTGQQNLLVKSVDKLEKTNSNLNDQLAAMNREMPVQTKTQASTPTVMAEDWIVSPKEMIQQQLVFVEFALKQQQYHLAVEKLANLNQDLEDFPLTLELRNSLHLAISKDIAAIQQYVTKSDMQQLQVNQLINELNRTLNQEISQPKLQAPQKDNAYFWQKWISVEVNKKPAEALMQRSIILKEVQLRLLIARESLAQGKYIAYHQEMNDIQDLLKKLPDQKAEKLLQHVEKLNKLTVLPAPLLNTKSLLG